MNPSPSTCSNSAGSGIPASCPGRATSPHRLPLAGAAVVGLSAVLLCTPLSATAAAKTGNTQGSPTPSGSTQGAPTQSGNGSCSAQVALAGAPNPAPVGSIVRVTATVTTSRGTPAGSVAFFSGTRSLGSSLLTSTGQTSAQASVTTSFSAPGFFRLSATLSSVATPGGTCQGSGVTYEGIYQPYGGGGTPPSATPPPATPPPATPPPATPPPAAMPPPSGSAPAPPASPPSPSHTPLGATTGGASTGPPGASGSPPAGAARPGGPAVALIPLPTPRVVPAPEAAPISVAPVSAPPPEPVLSTVVASAAGRPGLIPSLYFHRHPIFGLTLASLSLITALALLVGWDATRSSWLARRGRPDDAHSVAPW